MPKQYPIRPYARLLTMLGEQLIKNETIALIELIKNCYDADATAVKVTFENFGENYAVSEHSKIIIEDNGCGMTEKTILEHFLNPATPEKKRRKEKKPQTTLGRVMQGEKGIGRFAALKLGKKITITTYTQNDTKESVVVLDFSDYDEDFSAGIKDQSLFLDELTASVTKRFPKTFAGQTLFGKYKNNSGTRIEIEHIRGAWNQKKINDVIKDVNRMTPPVFFQNEKLQKQDFVVRFCPENQIFSSDSSLNDVKVLLEEKHLFYVEGKFIDKNKPYFAYSITKGGGHPKELKLFLDDSDFQKLSLYKKSFPSGIDRPIECGSFTFSFYIFDFSANTSPRYKIDKKLETDLLKSHRIYLYRDGVRVYPYGNPDDDWLQIDVARGTISAGSTFSNDQVVGYIGITQKDNPHLQDKTNREGLIETGNATSDFTGLLRSFLAYIRRNDFQQFRAEFEKNQNTIKAQDIFNQRQVETAFQAAQKAIEEKKPNALKLLKDTEEEYKREREYLVRRAETTEQLAGVGLSVETASHDITMIMRKALTLNDDLINDTQKDSVDTQDLNTRLTTLRGMLSFVDSTLKDVQQIFRSSRQRRKNIRVREALDKVHNIYKRQIEKSKIRCNIKEIGSPLVVKTTDAVLLQVFINLFDNAIYWKNDELQDRKIEVCLNGDETTLYFSDNGIGIPKEDVPYIFEPFYTGKGEDGRGLGLYIARQLLSKDDYSIRLAESKSEKFLSGANFVIRFYSEGEDVDR
ncbi:MAG: ATP-binding protein [Dysgonamonadaceae bacterium]|jgi:signal transduction histidine kinase|nr:ATP-binding protein [Dysgonamonadaceae bacterium]